MTSQSTMDKLYNMRLSVMAQAYRDQDELPGAADMTFDERFAMVVDAEWDARRVNKRTRLLRQAGFSDPEANVADVRYDADRKLDKARMAELSNCEWVRNHRNVLITGASGAGKSWIACALGVAACNAFFSVRYVRLPEMLDELVVDKDDEWLKMKKRYLKCDLLILDDWLLEKVDGKRARELLEIVKGRKRPSPNQAAHHCHVAACPGTVQQHSVESRSKNGAIVTRRGCRVPAPRSPPR